MAKGCKPCCSLPHGWLSLAVAIVATIGLSMSLNTLSNCRFVTISRNDSIEMREDMPGVVDVYSTLYINRGYGLSTYEKYENSCQPYNEGWDVFPEELGSMHIAARAFAIVATVFGVITMIISWCICCISCDMRFIKGLGVTYACIMVFQGLAFLMFGADLCKRHECVFANAAGLNIAAVILWAIASILSFLVQPFDESATDRVLPMEMPAVDQKNVKEKITEVINADGTKVITREVLHADGSKVVETTKIGKDEVVEKEPDIEVDNLQDANV